MRRKANRFERFVINLLNGIFVRTVGSWGAFIIDEEGHFVDDWGIEDEYADTSVLSERTADKTSGINSHL